MSDTEEIALGRVLWTTRHGLACVSDTGAWLKETTRSTPPRDLEVRAVAGGLLVQERDAVDDDRLDVVCGDLSEREWDDLRFAWTVCKHVTSNAIVIARNRQTLGIGAGQQSRVDAVRLAVDKARDRGHELADSVLASDAFFPFADGPLAAVEAGVRVIVQPGGAKRDPEVIAAVEQSGAAMVFTGRRHFRH